MEAALGVSYVGKRALVCMKHVGMNVCADAFVNSAITGVNGGVVVLAADDPSMHSSQNEQDSRFYGKFALIPILEPSSQQEALRHDVVCIRPFGTNAYAGTDAHYYPHGTLSCGSRSAGIRKGSDLHGASVGSF